MICSLSFTIHYLLVIIANQIWTFVSFYDSVWMLFFTVFIVRFDFYHVGHGASNTALTQNQPDKGFTLTFLILICTDLLLLAQ